MERRCGMQQHHTQTHLNNTAKSLLLCITKASKIHITQILKILVELMQHKHEYKMQQDTQLVFHYECFRMSRFDLMAACSGLIVVTDH